LKKSILPFVIIGAVFLVSIGVSVWLFNQGPKNPGTNGNGNSPANGPVNAGNLPPGADPAHVEGNPNAKVVLEEFGDFQCPPCGVFHPDAKAIVAEFGDRIKFVFRNNPLRIHQYAYDAARAAEAAGIQGKYWEMHDKLYDNQATWSTAPDPRAEFENYARLLGLNVDQFRADMLGELAATRVSRDMRRGEAMGVTGTPTVFLNGRLLKYEDTNAARLRILINEELKK
jgi:protein-disulfide isomerase